MPKKCKKCEEIKDIEDFVINRPICKSCKNKKQKLYYLKNKDRINKKSRDVWPIKRTETLKRVRKYYMKNKEKIKKLKREYYNDNKEKCNERAKAWKADNRQKVNAKERARYAKNKKTICKKLNAKRRGNLNLRLSNNMARYIGKALNGAKGNHHWEKIVGYTVQELIAHLESQFVGVMAWDNYGKYGWHIDHIIPISAFNYTNMKHMDFKKCWVLSNLQPMWAKDNLSKCNRIDKHFQPSLLLEGYQVNV